MDGQESPAATRGCRSAAERPIPHRQFSPVPPQASLSGDDRLSREERANQLTHALGLVMSLCGAPIVWQQATSDGALWRMAGGLVYLITLVALYAASTLSHSFTNPRWRERFRTLDQVCIFLLIAGSFTPIALSCLSSWLLWPLMAAVWGCALLGAAMKLFVAGNETVSLAVYLLAGWLGVLGLGSILQAMPLYGVLSLVGGGLCYTGGLWFWLRSESHPGSHAIWHLFVIAGSCLHFHVIVNYALAA